MAYAGGIGVGTAGTVKWRGAGGVGAPHGGPHGGGFPHGAPVQRGFARGYGSRGPGYYGGRNWALSGSCAQWSAPLSRALVGGTILAIGRQALLASGGQPTSQNIGGVIYLFSLENNVLIVRSCTAVGVTGVGQMPSAMTYKVKAGDSFGSIAYAFTGSAASWPTLAYANPGVSALKVGHLLRVPAAWMQRGLGGSQGDLGLMTQPMGGGGSFVFSSSDSQGRQVARIGQAVQQIGVGAMQPAGAQCQWVMVPRAQQYGVVQTLQSAMSTLPSSNSAGDQAATSATTGGGTAPTQGYTINGVSDRSSNPWLTVTMYGIGPNGSPVSSSQWRGQPYGNGELWYWSCPITIPGPNNATPNPGPNNYYRPPVVLSHARFSSPIGVGGRFVPHGQGVGVAPVPNLGSIQPSTDPIGKLSRMLRDGGMMGQVVSTPLILSTAAGTFQAADPSMTVVDPLVTAPACGVYGPLPSTLPATLGILGTQAANIDNGIAPTSTVAGSMPPGIYYISYAGSIYQFTKPATGATTVTGVCTPAPAPLPLPNPNVTPVVLTTTAPASSTPWTALGIGVAALALGVGAAYMVSRPHKTPEEIAHEEARNFRMP